jgi:hypothetical protein
MEILLEMRAYSPAIAGLSDRKIDEEEIRREDPSQQD